MKLDALFSLAVVSTVAVAGSYALVVSGQRMVDRQLASLRGPRLLDKAPAASGSRRVALFLVALWVFWLPLLFASSSWNLLVLLLLWVLGVVCSLLVLLLTVEPPRIHLALTWPLLVVLHTGVLWMTAGIFSRDAWRSQLEPQHRSEVRVREVGLALERWAATSPGAVERLVADDPRAAIAIEHEGDRETLRLDASQLDPAAPALLRTALEGGSTGAERALVDGWGWRIEVRAGREPSGVLLFVVRSPGADGAFETEPYPLGSFPPSAATQDVVWAAGLLWRGPETGL